MKTNAVIEADVTLALPATVAQLQAAAERYGRPLVVGIDPGDETGVALAAPGRDGHWAVRAVMTASPIEAVVAVVGLVGGDDHVVAVEDARLRQHYGNMERLIYGKMRNGLRLSNAEINTYKGRLQGSGWVRTLSKVMVEALLRNGLRVVRVMPGYAKTKVDPTRLADVTGYRRRTNSHERDAAMIAMLPMLRQPHLFDTDEPMVLR